MELLRKSFKSSIAVVIVMSFIFSPIVSLKPIMAATTETVIVEASQPSEDSSTMTESLPSEAVSLTEASSEGVSSASATDKEVSSFEQDSDTSSEASSATQVSTDETTVSETSAKVEPTKEADASQASGTSQASEVSGTSELKETKVGDELTLSEKEKAFREKLAADGEAEENHFIIRISDGLITGYREDTVTDLVIPSTVDGHAVKGIDTKAFERKGIRSLSLPEGIESIGEEAFAQNDLREITIPNSLLSIGVRAFAYNNHLEEIKFGNQPKLREIKKMAFRNNDLKAFEAPDSLETIENAAFFLNKISNLTLGSVQEIGDYAFSSNKLSEVVLPDTLTTLGSHVFDKNNRYVYTTGSSIGKTDITKGAFGSIHNPISIKVKGVDKDTQKVILPVTVIKNDPIVEVAKSELLYEGARLRRPAPKISGYNADFILIELTKEAIEDNKVNPYVIQYFDEKYKPSFNGLTAIQVKINGTVDLRTGVTAVSGSGQDLTDLIVINPETVDTSIQGVKQVEYSVTDASGNTIRELRDILVGIDPMKIEIGNDWLMEDFVFDADTLVGFSELGKEKLKRNKALQLPSFNPITSEKLRNIGENAFSNKNLVSVLIPDSYNYIGVSAFEGNKLTEIKFPEALKRIDDFAFRYNNFSMTELIVFPDKLKSIGRYAFYESFDDDSYKLIPTEDLGPNKEYKNIIFSEGLEIIEEGAFKECEGLWDVYLPNSLKYIGAYAFFYTPGEFHLGNGIKEIGAYAFSTSYRISSELPDSLKKIGDFAFKNTNLQGHLELPNSVDEIGIGVFEKNEITSFSWPSYKLPIIPDNTFKENKIEELPDLEGVTEIGDYAFLKNDFESIVLPSTLKTIGNEAFSSNKKTINNIKLNEGLQRIGQGAFEKAKINVPLLEMPSTLKEIDSNAFTKNNLDELILNEGLIRLEEGAFESAGIQSLSLPSTLEEISDYAFASNRIKELVIPEGVSSIGEGAFKADERPSLNYTTGALIDKKLYKVNFPSTLIEIKNGAFENQNLSVLDLPNNLVRIGEKAFAGNHLSTLNLPDKLSEIAKAAFQGNKINTLNFSPNSELSLIGEEAFRNNDFVETNFPASVSSIGRHAFLENPGMVLKPRHVGLKILDEQGEPINPNHLENEMDKATDSGYIINPSYITVKFQLANGRTIAPDRHYWGTIGNTIDVTPKENVAYMPEDTSTRHFRLEKEGREKIILYTLKPDFDPTGYNIRVNHMDIQGRSDNKQIGEKSFYTTEIMPFTIKASVSGDVQGLSEPYILVDFNKLVSGGYVKDIIYPNLNSLQSILDSWTFNNGILELRFKKNGQFGGPATFVEIPLSIRFQKYNTPKDYVLDLTEAVYLYDVDTSVKVSTDDVRFKAKVSPLSSIKYANNRESGLILSHSDYDTEGYSPWTSNREVKFTYSIRASRADDQRYYNRLYIEDVLPTYEGKDADGVIQTNLKAQINTKKSPGWKLSPDGRKAIYEASLSRGVFSQDFSSVPLYLNFPGVKKEQTIRNTQNYTLTPYNRAKTSVLEGKKITDEGALVLEPVESLTDSVNFIFREEKVTPVPTGYFAARLKKDSRDFYGADSRGVPSVVGDPKSKRIKAGSVKYGYKNILQTASADRAVYTVDSQRAQRSFISSFFDNDSDRHQTFTWEIQMLTVGRSQITDLVVKEFGLDNRMKYVGVWLPDDFTPAILKAYDDFGSVLLEDTVYAGTYMFPETLQSQIKSFTLDFQSMVIGKEDATSESSKTFQVYTKLKNPEVSAFTDDGSSGTSFYFDPNLFWNHSSMSSTVIWTNDEGITIREHYDTQEVKDAIHVLPYESVTSLIKTIKNRPLGTDENTPEESLNYGINQQIRFDLKTKTFKPKALAMQEFKFLDVLPPYLLPEDVIFSEAFLEKAKNPSFDFIENFEGSNRWAVVIKADSYNPGGEDFQEYTETFAELVTRTSTSIENNIYTNQAYLTAKGDKAWERASDNKPNYRFFENDINVIKAEERYSVLTVKSFSAFKFVKNSRDKVYSLLETELESEEPFSYRLTLANNTNDPVQNLVIYDVLPYFNDLRLVQNNDGQRVPRGTTLNKIGDEAMPKVSLNGPVQIPASYADLYDVYYSTASTDTFRGADEKVITTDESLWSTSVSNYADVTAIRIKLKAGEQVLANSTHHFILPMKAPLNPNYQYDGMQTNNSFAYRTGSEKAPFIEGNNVRTLQKSFRTTLEVRKKSTWPTEKNQYLPGAVFQLFRLAPETASEDEVMTKGEYRVYKNPVFVPQGGVYVSEVRTNANGIATFKDLFLNTDYLLEEVRTPSGYAIPRNASPYTLITAQELQGTEDRPRFFSKDIFNDKSYFPLIKPITASLEFYKYGVDNKPLSNTVFEISLDYNHPDFKDLKYGEGDLANYKKINFEPRRVASTTNGSVYFDNLPVFGEKYPPYIIKEITPRGVLQAIEPFHYKPYAKNGIGEKRVIQKPIVNDKAEVKFYKLGMVDLNYKNVKVEKIATYMGIRLPDVLIQLYDKETNSLVEEARTDEQGLILFSNLKINHDYYLVEPNKLDEYKPYTDLENDNKLRFSVNATGTIIINDIVSNFRYIAMPNYPERDTNQINIQKVDKQGQPLAGAVFELYKIHDDENSDNEANETDVTSNIDLSPKLVATGTTDNRGNITFKDFGMGEEAGKFRLVEKKAPLGYLKTFEPFEFKTYSNTIFFKNLRIPNNPIKLTLDKYYIDEANLKQPLSGAKFALYEGDATTGTLLEEAISNDQGKVIFNYALWDTEKQYSVKELEAPEGYSLDPNVLSIPLSGIVNRTKFSGALHYERINEKIKHTGAIVITKIDKFSNTVISDVHFTLTNDETGVIQEGKTNRLGVLRFRDLPYGTYTLNEIPLEGYQAVESQKVTISEDHSIEYMLVKNIPITQSLTLKKVNELDQPLANVEFELERKFTDTNWTDRVTGRTSETGVLIFDNLIRNSIYRLKEIDASQATPVFEGDTYQLPDEYYIIQVNNQGDISITYKDQPVSLPLNIVNERSNKKSSRDLTVKKVWIGGEPFRTSDIQVQLYRQDHTGQKEAIGQPVELIDNQGVLSYTYTGLPAEELIQLENRQFYQDYRYTVEEVNVPAGFTSSLEEPSEAKDYYSITNTYNVPKGEVQATKTWVGGSAIDKPDTWFKLYRKTDAMETVEAVPNAEVKKLVNGVVDVTWTGLEKTDLQGRPYTFSVKETDAQGNSIAPRNWTKSGDDTLAITNTYVSPRMKLTAEKAWVDGESLTKPDIWFKLMRKTDAMTDYEAVPNAEVKKLSDGQTQIEWTAIEETDAEARTYDFVVKEVNEAGEEAVPTNWQGEQTTAFKITNSYVIPRNGVVQATKTWVGGEAISKPDVWFMLYRKTVNDTAFKVVPDAEIKKLENGTTEVSWTGLEETDLQGYPYSFAVKETDAEGNAYSPENWKQVEGENLAIVNEYVPPVAKVSAEKVWVNGESLTKPDTWFKLFRKVNPAEAEAETDAEASEAPEAGADAEANEAPEAGADAEASEAPEAGADAEASEAPEAGADAEANEAPEAGADAEASEAPEAGADAEASEAPEAGADAEASEAPEAGADAEASEATDVDVNPDADLEVVPNAEVTLLSDGTTKVNWSNIDQTDKAGRPYSFYVREVDAEGNDYTPINWKKEQTEDLKITNSYVIPEDASATAEKVWVGGPEAKPSVWFKLYREAKHTAVEAVPNAVVKELSDGLTKVSWNNLERTNLQGEAYEFSVREVDENGMNFVPENYSKEEAGLTVTNTFVPSKDATATAEKIWVGGPSEHPTIWFTLYRKTEDMKDFEQVPEAMIKELSSGETKVVWTNLQKTDDHARTYSFIVRETDAEGNAFVPKQYKKEELGLKVKNTYIPKPAKVSKTGETLGSLSISVFLLALAALVTELRRRVLRKNA